MQQREEKFVKYDQVFTRLNVLDNIEKLKDQIQDIEDVVKDDINTNDLDIINLNNRINDIQEQIKNLMKK